mmetsp:Transcript_10766/g.34352  ORF Transcript_10766/g.34352 Transcript_10766/m.34352 type:complete len:433 (+) Transcript_10766:351-1649(+)
MLEKAAQTLPRRVLRLLQRREPRLELGTRHKQFAVQGEHAAQDRLTQLKVGTRLQLGQHPVQRHREQVGAVLVLDRSERHVSDLKVHGGRAQRRQVGDHRAIVVVRRAGFVLRTGGLRLGVGVLKELEQLGPRPSQPGTALEDSRAHAHALIDRFTLRRGHLLLLLLVVVVAPVSGTGELWRSILGLCRSASFCRAAGRGERRVDRLGGAEEERRLFRLLWGLLRLVALLDQLQVRERVPLGWLGASKAHLAVAAGRLDAILRLVAGVVLAQLVATVEVQESALLVLWHGGRWRLQADGPQGDGVRPGVTKVATVRPEGDSHRVRKARRQKLSCGRERETRHRGGELEPVDAARRWQVPDAQARVVARRCEPASVRADGHVRHRSRVALEGTNRPTRGGVEHHDPQVVQRHREDPCITVRHQLGHGGTEVDH